MTGTRDKRAAPSDLRLLLLAAGVLSIAQIGSIVLAQLHRGIPASRLPVLLAPWVFHWLMVVVVLVPGLLLAERASALRGRAVPYALVVLAGSALVEALMIPLAAWIFGRHLQHSPMIFLDTTMRMGLAALVFAAYREQREAVDTVQALETRRNEMMARLAASRLSAARTRVQPEAVIGELRAIRASYVLDPATAEVGLEALITRLRAASRSSVP
jgi:hypothetical protein